MGLNAQTLRTHNFDDGDLFPFKACSVNDPNYTINENGRVKTFWIQSSFDGSRGTKGAEMCCDDVIVRKHGWYGYTINLGADYQTDKQAGIAQIFQFSSSTFWSWVVMMDMTEGDFTITHRGPSPAAKTEAVVYPNFPKETDMNVVIGFTLSKVGNGMVEIWINGESRYRADNISLGFGSWDANDVQTGDHTFVTFKTGQYNYQAADYRTGETSTVYYDNVSYYNGENGFDIVDPSKGDDLIDYNEFRNAVVVDENPKQVLVELTENVAVAETYEGFVVEVDNVAAAIESVTMVDSLHLAINLSNTITLENELTVSYEAGNVLTELDAPLISFESKMVNNLMIGSAPVLQSIATSDDGTQLQLFFNKKMQLPSSIGSLLLTADYMGTKNISITDADFYSNDSIGLVLTLSDTVYYDYQLLFNCDNAILLSNDNGGVKAIVDLAVENSAPGLPLEIETSSVDTSGLFVNFKFNRVINQIHDPSDNFTLTINNKSVAASKSVASDSAIHVYPVGKIFLGDVVEISYAPSEFVSIVATNTAELKAFSALSIENASTLSMPVLPSKIESENYDDQSGVELENCGEGGQNLAYIHTNDWVEYDVNVLKDTTYKATFRVASPKSGGAIAILIDGSTKGIVDIPNTGNWQGYTSVSADMKLNSGAHKLKLLFTGEFNVNWMEFEETAPGNEGLFFDRIEIESFDSNSGGNIETCSDTDGGENVGSLRNGNWLKFSDVDLSEVGSVDMRLAGTNANGTVEIRLGSATGTLIGIVETPNTGGWQTWETVSAGMNQVEGTHDVYLVFKTSGSWVCNINWFQLSTTIIEGPSVIRYLDNDEVVSFYPNPVYDYLNIDNRANSILEIYNSTGQKVQEAIIRSDSYSISVCDLQSGTYIVKLKDEATIVNGKFIKQ